MGPQRLTDHWHGEESENQNLVTSQLETDSYMLTTSIIGPEGHDAKGSFSGSSQGKLLSSIFCYVGNLAAGIHHDTNLRTHCWTVWGKGSSLCGLEKDLLPCVGPHVSSLGLVGWGLQIQSTCLVGFGTSPWLFNLRPCCNGANRNIMPPPAMETPDFAMTGLGDVALPQNFTTRIDSGNHLAVLQRVVLLTETTLRHLHIHERSSRCWKFLVLAFCL